MTVGVSAKAGKGQDQRSNRWGIYGVYENVNSQWPCRNGVKGNNSEPGAKNLHWMKINK